MSANIRRSLMAILTLAGLAFLLAVVWKYRAVVLATVGNASIAELCWAVAALLLSNVGVALVFVALLPPGGQAGVLTGRGLAGAFLMSQVGKYVPGRLWGIVLQRMAAGGPVSMRNILLVNLDLAVLAVVGTSGAALGYLAWLWQGPGMAILVLSAVAAAGCLCTRWRLALHGWALLARYFPSLRDCGTQTPGPGRSGLRATGVLFFVGGYFVGVLLLVASMASSSMDQALRLAAILSLSYLVGLASMLPAGIGAREVTLFGLAGLMELDMGLVASLAVVMRAATLAVDLASLPIGGVLMVSSLQNREP